VIRVMTPDGAGVIVDEISQTFGHGRFSFVQRWAIVQFPDGHRKPYTGKQLERI